MVEIGSLVLSLAKAVREQQRDRVTRVGTLVHQRLWTQHGHIDDEEKQVTNDRSNFTTYQVVHLFIY